jgi:hypothetical protein
MRSPFKAMHGPTLKPSSDNHNSEQEAWKRRPPSVFAALVTAQGAPTTTSHSAVAKISMRVPAKAFATIFPSRFVSRAPLRWTELASHQHLPMKLGCSQDKKHLSEHVQIKPSRTSPSKS